MSDNQLIDCMRYVNRLQSCALLNVNAEANNSKSI